MKRTPLIIAAVAFFALAGSAAFNMLPNAWAANSVETQTAAAEQTVTFAVEKMTCAVCPITVRKAIEKVEGVKSVSMNFSAKTTTVVFDPAIATPEQIGAASTNAGYPASPTS
ncbi:MAG: heavy metal transporter [Gammaproteobacteria bacterium]|nr:MAG: heavy metal transporter [Gammaproteobacteria bacterium]